MLPIIYDKWPRSKLVWVHLLFKFEMNTEIHRGNHQVENLSFLKETKLWVVIRVCQKHVELEPIYKLLKRGQGLRPQEFHLLKPDQHLCISLLVSITSVTTSLPSYYCPIWEYNLHNWTKGIWCFALLGSVEMFQLLACYSDNTVVMLLSSGMTSDGGWLVYLDVHK